MGGEIAGVEVKVGCRRLLARGRWRSDVRCAAQCCQFNLLLALPEAQLLVRCEVLVAVGTAHPHLIPAGVFVLLGYGMATSITLVVVLKPLTIILSDRCRE